MQHQFIFFGTIIALKPARINASQARGGTKG